MFKGVNNNIIIKYSMTIKTIKRKVMSGIKNRHKTSKKKRIKSIRKKKKKVSKKRKIKGGVYNKGPPLKKPQEPSLKKLERLTKRQIELKTEMYKNLIERWSCTNPPSHEVFSNMLSNSSKDICAIPAYFVNDGVNKVYGHSFYEGTNIYMDCYSFKHVQNILSNSRGRHVVSFLSLFVHSSEPEDMIMSNSYRGMHSMMLFASHGNIYIIDHTKRGDGVGFIVLNNGEEKHSIPIIYINTSWQEEPNNDCHFLTMKAMIVLGEFIVQNKLYRPFAGKDILNLQTLYSDSKERYEDIFTSIKQAITGAIIPYRTKRGVNSNQSATTKVCAREICDSASTEYSFNVSELNGKGLFLYMPPNNMGIFKADTIQKQKEVWKTNLDMAADLLNPDLLTQLKGQLNNLIQWVGF
jgi:hypothetical protein